MEICHVSLVDFIGTDRAKPALIVAQIAKGLDCLHSKNIIHGALKPENVMIWIKRLKSRHFIVKITDYGFKAMTTAQVK